MAHHLKKIGLYGGTFNPIHNGHLQLACQLKENAGLDEIWFIPAAISPFKQKEVTAGMEDRLAMVKLAIEGEESFHVLDIEIKKNTISYTIDTVRDLKKKYPYQFFLCIANDSLPFLSKWKEIDELLVLIRPLIGNRGNWPTLLDPALSVETAETVKAGLIKTSAFELSGSEIRKRIKKKMFCTHLVPQKVLDYIYCNQLYFNE